MKTRIIETGLQMLVVFKRWSRKGYSLFRVLNRIVAIAVLNVAYFFSADAASSAFESDTTHIAREIKLDEVEVSAQRSPVTFSQAARVVSVITQKEIEAAPASTVQELLDYVLSTDIRQRGGEGSPGDLSIRGSSFDQVMVLLNGVDITDPQTGHHSLNLPVTLNQIERIEIIEGPASRVFGPNAFSGAINFITRTVDTSSISGTATLGSHSLFNGNLSVRVRSGNLSQLISADHRTSEGYTRNTDFENYNIYYGAESGSLALQIGNSSKAFGANSFYTPKYPDQYEITNTSFTSLKWQPNTPFHFSSTLYGRRNTDKFELFRTNAPAWYNTHNFHLTHVYGMNLNGWFFSLLGKTSFGTHFRSENIKSNVLGKPLDEPIIVKGEDAVYTKSDHRQIYSVFAEHSYISEKLAISAGILVNYYSEKSKTWFFPGVDVSYKLSQSSKIYASANKSLRMPTFTDLYYSGPTNTGNPDLKPETANAFEIGLKFNRKNISAHLASYYRKGENIIDWVRLANEEKWHTENLTQLASYGFEANFEYVPAHRNGSQGFISRISAGYMFNHLDKHNSGFVSNYVLDNLKHKFNIRLEHRVFKKLMASWVLLAQDRNGSYTSFENGVWGSEKAYKPFVLLDGKLAYRLKELNFFVSATNIFNTRYFDFGNIVQPGRWLKVGLSFEIDFN